MLNSTSVNGFSIYLMRAHCNCSHTMMMVQMVTRLAPLIKSLTTHKVPAIVQLVKRLALELKSLSVLKRLELRRVYKQEDRLWGCRKNNEGFLQLFLAGLAGIQKLDYLELEDEQDSFTLTRYAQCHPFAFSGMQS